MNIHVEESLDVRAAERAADHLAVFQDAPAAEEHVNGPGRRERLAHVEVRHGLLVLNLLVLSVVGWRPVRTAMVRHFKQSARS